MKLWLITLLVALLAPCSILAQLPGAPVCVCPPPQACYQSSGCDPLTGSCLYHIANDGTACQDTECCCIISGLCLGGVCKSNTTQCPPPPNPCQQIDLCAPGCGYKNLPDGTPCSSGDPCSNTQCYNGQCIVTDYKQCTPPNDCFTSCCDPTTGECILEMVDNGSPCSDGNACTVGDSCYNGTCKPGNLKECPYTTDCYTPGKCDQASGECLYFLAPDGTPCTEESCCIFNGVCLGGHCFPQTNCPPINNTCLQPTLCPGQCGTKPVPDGTPCDDNNLCTIRDTCVAGSCSAGTPKVCPPADQCHYAGVCDPRTGVCTYTAVADGTSCEDGDFCTLNDTCVAGQCVGGHPLVCNPPNDCYEPGFCSNNGTCVFEPAPNGTACSIPETCTTGTCEGGECVPTTVICPSPPVCQVVDACHSTPGNCAYLPAPDGTACNNPCFLNSSCIHGQCVAGVPIDCPPAPACYMPGTCDSSTGICRYLGLPDATPCDDGNLCTINDTCLRGVCQGVSKLCPQPEGCFLSAGCDNTTGFCQYRPSPDGSPCIKQDCCCVTNGTCIGGACIPQVTECAPAPPCQQLRICGGLCEYINLPDGGACDDGDACTFGETCIQGECRPSSFKQCPTPSVCQQPGVCNNVTGACQYANIPDGYPCEDNNLCSNSSCISGVCTASNPKTCPPPPICQAGGVCNPESGNCQYSVLTNGSPCGTGCSCYFGMCKNTGNCVTFAQCEALPDCGGGPSVPPMNQTICVDEIASYQMKAPLNTYLLSDFNLMSFNSFLATSGDTEGRLAVRGDAVITGGFSIGAQIQSGLDASRPYALVVGGSLSWAQGSLNPNSEGMYVGGNITNTPSYLTQRRTGGPCAIPGCLDSTFNDAYLHLKALGDQWSKTTPNTQAQIVFSGMQVTTSDANAARYYISIPDTQFVQNNWVLTGLNLNAEFIITITGTGNINFQGGSFPGKPEKTVWNIPGNRTISIGGHQLVGTLMAPDATLQQGNGVTQGFMYIGNVQSFVQINLVRCPSNCTTACV